MDFQQSAKEIAAKIHASITVTEVVSPERYEVNLSTRKQLGIDAERGFKTAKASKLLLEHLPKSVTRFVALPVPSYMRGGVETVGNVHVRFIEMDQVARFDVCFDP